MEQAKEPTVTTQPSFKGCTFFSGNINELSIPVRGNVLCKKKKEDRYCYAFLNKGKIYTGFCFAIDDYEYKLDPSVWEIYDVIKK